MEARVESLQASAPKRREPCTGRESGWQLSRSLEDSEKPGDAYRVSSLLLRLAWPSKTVCSEVAQSTEPPYADPHVRWCGRGGEVTFPPIPIHSSSGHMLAALLAQCS